MRLHITREQAALRDEFIKKDEKRISFDGVNVNDVYVKDIVERCFEGCVILDIGTGTAHIPAVIAKKCRKKIRIIALDLSRYLIDIAKQNTAEFENIEIVRGDGHHLPFKDCSFDIVTIRLAPHKTLETHRVLKRGGWYIHYGCGRFNCFKEVHEIFGNRAEDYCSQDWWKTSWERLKRLDQRGFNEVQEKAFLVKKYYTFDQLVRHIKFDPIVKDFDPHTDMPQLLELKRKHETEKGIRITSDPLILIGRKR